MKHDRCEIWKQFTLVLLLFVAGVATAAVDKAAREGGNWAPPDVDQAVPPAKTQRPRGSLSVDAVRFSSGSRPGSRRNGPFLS